MRVAAVPLVLLVGQKLPNPWGLYDVVGNASQWVADWFGENYYQTSEPLDPAGPPAGRFRVLRGGSWDNGPLGMSVLTRFAYDQGTRTNSIGFRCVAE